MPLKFDVCSSGKANTEARQLQSHPPSSLGCDVQASLVNAASSTSDNAARATSNERQKLSVEEVVKAKAVIDSHLVARP
jgi:hypothetical protein